MEKLTTPVLPRSLRGEGKQRRGAARPAWQRSGSRGAARFGRVVTPRGLAGFTRQLATLVRAGVPLLRALEVLERQEQRGRFRRVIAELGEVVRSGGTLSEGLAAYPRVFDRLYVNMVKAGEAGGVLAIVLERLAGFMEKAQRITGKVKAAMIYPVIIIVVAVVIVSVLMVVVVPEFQGIFSGLLKGQPLPTATQRLLQASRLLREHAVLLPGVALGGWIVWRALATTATGRRGVDWLLLRLPLVGDLFLRAAIARFSRTLGTLLASGVPILQALLITRETSGHGQVAEALRFVHDRVKEGDPVARPLEAARIFPAMVTSMIDVGEETGALPEMLTRIADTYDEEVDTAVAGLTSIIEPIMIVFMAVVVGSIVVALFLPLVSIIQHLS